MEVKHMMQSCSIFPVLSEDSFKDFLTQTIFYLFFFYHVATVELRMMHFVVVNMRKYIHSWTTPQQYFSCHAENECFIRTSCDFK